MMTRIFIIAICLVSFAGCKNSPAHFRSSRYASLIKQYRDTTFDTLHVFFNYDSLARRFGGVELDSAQVELIPISAAQWSDEKGHERAPYTEGYFACYKFRIDKKN